MGLVKIKFDDTGYLRLQNGATHIDDFVSHLFLNESNRRLIAAELQNYHSDEDGAPVANDFKIDSATYNPSTLSGQIRFAYHVDFTFACADKRATTNHFETSDFTIDRDFKTLSVSIHDKISRDTFEEF